ncbi:hypothetical protein KFE25_012231 [Diacronema lutheri]|uniref:DNA 3'-5' helicase n=1 Tax=Diacronema lutheri TaxID=2081491 RepID=A0A8J6C8Z2_DIALT|nr:hypothetical protein KFE25_012231 [Diacronema lutheri]
MGRKGTKGEVPAVPGALGSDAKRFKQSTLAFGGGVSCAASIAPSAVGAPVVPARVSAPVSGFAVPPNETWPALSDGDTAERASVAAPTNHSQAVSSPCAPRAGARTVGDGAPGECAAGDRVDGGGDGVHAATHGAGSEWSAIGAASAQLRVCERAACVPSRAARLLDTVGMPRAAAAPSFAAERPARAREPPAGAPPVGARAPTLNAEQRAVADANDGLILVRAGPGSGKTRALVGRVCALVAQRSVAARDVLCLAFSTKAAAELQARLAGALPPATFGHVAVHTFHSACLHLLRERHEAAALAADVPRGFHVAARQADACLAEALGDAGVAGTAVSAVRALLERRRNAAAERAAVADVAASATPGAHADAEALARALRAAAAAAGGGSGEGGDDDETGLSERDLAAVERCYRARLRARAPRARAGASGGGDGDDGGGGGGDGGSSGARAPLLDYDDLLSAAEATLRWELAQPGCARGDGGGYRHVLVDEFQDASVQQCSLVALLARAHGNCTAVGDADQAIFGWRHACAAGGEVLRLLGHFETITALRLDANYRSTPQIVVAARAMLAAGGAAGTERAASGRGGGGGGAATVGGNSRCTAAAGAVERGVPAAGMVAMRADGDRVRVLCCTDGAAECEAVAAALVEARARGVRPREMAVLVRVRAQVDAIARACAAHGLPVSGAGAAVGGAGAGGALASRADARDAAALLALAARGERADVSSFERALGLCAGVGDTTARRLLAPSGGGAWHGLLQAARGNAPGGGGAGGVKAATAASLASLVRAVRALSALLAPRAPLHEPVAPLSALVHAAADAAVALRGPRRLANGTNDGAAGAGGRSEVVEAMAAAAAAFEEDVGSVPASGLGARAGDAIAPPSGGAGGCGALAGDGSVGGRADLLLRFLESVGLASAGSSAGVGAPDGGASASDPSPAAAPACADGRVCVLTVHAAKGLEWETVILAGVTDDLFPHARAASSVGGCAEERRLLYVGMTRARTQLVLTHTGAPSRFLAPLNAQLVERTRIGGGGGGAARTGEDDGDGAHTRGCGARACGGQRPELARAGGSSAHACPVGGGFQTASAMLGMGEGADDADSAAPCAGQGGLARGPERLRTGGRCGIAGGRTWRLGGTSGDAESRTAAVRPLASSSAAAPGQHGGFCSAASSLGARQGCAGRATAASGGGAGSNRGAAARLGVAAGAGVRRPLAHLAQPPTLAELGRGAAGGEGCPPGRALHPPSNHDVPSPACSRDRRPA